MGVKVRGFSKSQMVALVFSTAALAQTPPNFQSMVTPSDGGLFCQDADDIVKMVLKQPPKGKCGVIPPGTKFLAAGVKEEQGFVGGVGVAEGINEGKAFAFFFIKVSSSVAKKKPNFSERNFKAVSPADIRNTPEKWIGRDIEIRSAQVYWVADDDVRIITNTNLTIFGNNVSGPDTGFLKENCETEQEAFSTKCRVSIKFSYEKHSEDNPIGVTKRIVIVTDDIHIARRNRR